MKSEQLRFYWANPSKDPNAFIEFPKEFELYIDRKDFLTITGIPLKRLELYLLRHPEIRTKKKGDSKFICFPEMFAYLAKLQRSEYGKMKTQKKSPENS